MSEKVTIIPGLKNYIPWKDLKKNSDGHVTVVVQDHKTLQVLMVAYMNEEAYEMTLKTKRMTYYSRSRSEHKRPLPVCERTDCRLRQRHFACQGRTGRRRMPYRKLQLFFQ